MLLRDFSAIQYSMNRKLLSGGNQGHEVLSLPNTTFSSRENSQGYRLAFSHGKGIFINFIALQNLFVLSEKRDVAKLRSESLNGLGKSGGTQVWAPLGV